MLLSASRIIIFINLWIWARSVVNCSLSVCTCNKYCTQLSKYCCYPSLRGSFYKVSGATTQRTAWQQRSWPVMMVTTMMVIPRGLVTRTPATTGATDQSRCTAQWPMLHPQTPQLASKHRWQISRRDMSKGTQRRLIQSAKKWTSINWMHTPSPASTLLYTLRPKTYFSTRRLFQTEDGNWY